MAPKLTIGAGDRNDLSHRTTVEINQVHGFCHLAGNIYPQWAGQTLKDIGKLSM